MVKGGTRIDGLAIVIRVAQHVVPELRDKGHIHQPVSGLFVPDGVGLLRSTFGVAGVHVHALLHIHVHVYESRNFIGQRVDYWHHFSPASDRFRIVQVVLPVEAYGVRVRTRLLG
jgi:hypothetical protein